MVEKHKIDGIFTEEYHAAINGKYRMVNPSDVCIMCGEKIKPDSGHFLYLTGMGEALIAKTAYINIHMHDDDLGYYPVGPTCGSKIPAKFRFARKGSIPKENA